MGPEYAGDAPLVLRILLIGFVFNSVAQIPFSKIQACGYSKTTALVHLIELIPYLLILFFCVKSFGLTGAAIAWAVRVTADFLILEYISSKISE
jgi:O-antigen/teichoic acid export membrane protein